MFITDADGLKAAVGERPISDLVDLSGGTEAVSAKYAAGTLLIMEYTNPQASTFADQNFQKRLAETPANPQIVYRRIGNYNAFVFDAADQAAANAAGPGQIRKERPMAWRGSVYVTKDRTILRSNGPRCRYFDCSFYLADLWYHDRVGDRGWCSLFPIPRIAASAHVRVL